MSDTPALIALTKRLAIFILETERDERGYIPCIAVEGEIGYYRTDWRWNCDLEMANRLADAKNARMGLSKTEAALIQLSTMGSEGRETLLLSQDITSPDRGTIARAGEQVIVLDYDENGVLVETQDGRVSFYVSPGVETK